MRFNIPSPWDSRLCRMTDATHRGTKVQSQTVFSGEIENELRISLRHFIFVSLTEIHEPPQPPENVFWIGGNSLIKVI